MRIFPPDLSVRWHAKLLELRAQAMQSHRAGRGRMAHALAGSQKLGPLALFWARDAGLEPQRAAAVLPAARSATVPAVFLTWWIGGWLSLMGTVILMKAAHLEPAAMLAIGPTLAGLVAWLGSAAGSHIFRTMNHRPIHDGEVELLLERESDETDRRFLELLRDSVRQPGPPEAEENLRAALRALSEAMERLPVVQMTELDTAALREEAARVLAQAAAESDRITAESLERRARAIVQRAEANESSALLARRSGALRAELEAQIAALREGLAALQVNSPDAVGFAELAHAARRIATEAAGVTAAREELDSAVGHWPVEQRAVEEAAPKVLRRG